MGTRDAGQGHQTNGHLQDKFSHHAICGEYEKSSECLMMLSYIHLQYNKLCMSCNLQNLQKANLPQQVCV